METKPEGAHRSFNASPHRLEILRRLILEFTDVVIIETPSTIPGDFMTHVNLSFTDAEQGEAFFRKMLDAGRQAEPDAPEPAR